MHCTNIIALVLLITLSKLVISENVKKNIPGFLLTMPKTLVSGKPETVCLSTHYTSISSPIKILIDLKMKEKHFFTRKTIHSEHACLELKSPEVFFKEPQFASVRVQVQLNDSIFSAHNQDPILVYPFEKITFIETDKRMYKSEDKVKIRILTMDHNLRPSLQYKVPIVRIRNPLGLGVIVWENVTTEMGLAQIEHQLSRDPVEGKWKVEANDETHIFEVSRYILPRFKVQIVHPKNIYYTVPSVPMKVCAKYSYGGIVKGTAFIKLVEYTNTMQTIQMLKKMSNGCAEFSFSNNELALSTIKRTFSMIDSKLSLQITATVTEDGSDRIEITTAKSTISLKPYDLRIIRKSILLPGLMYQGTVQFSNIEIDLTNEVIEICYNIAIRKSWNYLNNEQCSNITVKNENFVKFNILPMKNNVIHVQVNVRSLNHTNIADSLLLVRLYSPSSAYLTIDHMSYNPLSQTKCHSLQQFSVQYTADQFKENETVTFYFVVKTRNELFKLEEITHINRKFSINFDEYSNIIGSKHKHVKIGSSIGNFLLKFNLDETIISNYQLLVYYISNAGETISTTKEIYVEPCTVNKVEANWSHKQISPGETATLFIGTKSDSLCSVSAVDKAVKFMDNFGVLDIKSFLKPFLKEREPAESSRKSCIPPTKRNKEALALTEQEPSWDLKRRRRHVYSFSEDYDAYDVFSNFGVIVISNFKVITKPCYTGPVTSDNNPVQSLTDQYNFQNEDTTTSIRSYFPETWLWELVPVRNAAVIHRSLPHTITTWQTQILCVSPKDGIGFSKTTEITSYQPFFVDVLTPYSIKKGETLYLHVIVFNYLSYNLPIKINLDTSNNLYIANKSKIKGVSYCLLGNNTITHIFELKAADAGSANVTVRSELDSTYPGQCGPDVVVNKRDVVYKTLKIEPEGYPIKVVKSGLLCASGSFNLNNITWDFKVPNKVITKTASTKIILNGDILGPTITNLDDLIEMPTGCGEQIMSTLVPNLYILKYLNATGDLSSSTKRKILRNLKIGYQRILNYVHKDGSFSAFGYHDPMGSMFLTSFVVRTLQEINQYIYVDQRIISRAVSWVFNHQLENGCFNTMLHVFQDMGGTNLENSTAGLTSYVMISLLDSNIPTPDVIKTNAKYCIRGHYDLDKYTLAISSYALFKINWLSEAERMLKKLFQLANVRSNMMWWTNKDANGSTASDIEVTSYVLLSLLHQKSQENLAKAHSIVRWLTTKLGPRGSFRSTQDTAVALDALTRYSAFIKSDEVNLEIIIDAIDQKQHIRMGATNRLKSKKISLKNPNNHVNLRIEGHGCILAQGVLSYYIKDLPLSDAFKLDMEIMPVSNIDQCSIASLTPCFAYKGPDLQTNMAILEVDLPSGYEADRISLYKLINEDGNKKLKMFEELHQKVVLYFTKLDSHPVCINFNINENAIVESRAPSAVKLYDYYKPEYNTIQFYKLGEKCQKNLTISVTETNGSINEHSKAISKRGIQLNRNFVDLQQELDEPSGNVSFKSRLFFRGRNNPNSG